MADDARHARPDLEALAADTASMDFFELLRRLETADRRFGHAGGAAQEPARLGQGVRLSFATSDIAEIRLADAPGAPPNVSVNVIGLLGPEGPMPLHLTRWVMQRLSNRWFAGESERAMSDTAFLDFCNMLQHRAMTLYWRAWADNRAEVQVSAADGGQVTALLRALAGVGLPGTRSGKTTRAATKLRHATSLANQPQGPDRLVRYLESVVGTRVELREFVGVWTDLPERLQSRIGSSSAVLGRTAVAGSRVFERHARAEIRIGPLSRKDFLSFLHGADAAGDLRHALDFAAGHDVAFDLRLVLAARDVPEPRLGETRLGWTTWLRSKPAGDADDLAIRRFSAAGPAEDRAA